MAGEVMFSSWRLSVCSNSLYMLVRMSEHVINAEDTGSFLSKTFGNCLVQIKRNFDKFIVSTVSKRRSRIIQ